MVEGQQVNYKCNSGYSMNEDSTSKITCEDGMFSPSIAESGMKCFKGTSTVQTIFVF